ncbi:MAG: apolipoprotein N-acyltransferase [Chlorobi bacterium]|nr:apolipoprotein N-acyltransferase [Chlorobiota bacterium]
MKIFEKYRNLNSPEQKKKIHRQLLLGLASGILIGLSFPPIPLPYLIFIGLVPYFFALQHREGLAEINRLTYFTAFFFNIIILYWVGGWLPNSDPFLMIAGTTLFFFNPVVFLIPSTLYYFAKKVFNKNIALLLLPFFWVTYEYAYSITDFKFPWLTFGNSLPYFTSYIQIAEIIGVYGLTLLIIYSNVFIYRSIKVYVEQKKFDKFSISVAAAILIIPIIYGNYKISNYSEPEKTIRVGLIQPNLDPNKKWQAGSLDEQLNLYLDLSSKAISSGAELLIWPETALPVYLLAGRYPNEVNRLHEFVDTNNIPILTGMPDATFYRDSSVAPEYAKPLSSGKMVYTSYNSILYFSPNSRDVQKYGKIKLVPFGEKVPLVDVLPFLGDWIKWEVGLSGWNTGRDTTVFNATVGGRSIKIGGVICIESIYPDFTSVFVKKGAEFIAVVTNDSWYGDSSGPYQHKEISVIRAVENRRAVVRAANGGISCLIDPLGRTIADTKMYTRTFLVVDVPLEQELTFYTKHPLLIPLAASAVSIIIILLSLFVKIKRKFI